MSHERMTDFCAPSMQGRRPSTKHEPTPKNIKIPKSTLVSTTPTERCRAPEPPRRIPENRHSSVMTSTHSTWSVSKRESLITIPARAHPLARLLFGEMKRQRVSYDELEHRSGVLRCTFKSWRVEKVPGLTSIEAALGSLGWRLTPTPDPATLSPGLREELARVGRHFASEHEAAASCIAAWLASPLPTRTRENPAPNPNSIQWSAAA